MSFIEHILDGVQGVFHVNPSTLSGAIDVLVVKQADGTLKSTPFHVRFGKLQTLYPHEKVVTITIGERVSPLKMKLGSAGEAFFVEESGESVPEALMTSPLQSPVLSPVLAPDEQVEVPLISSLEDSLRNENNSNTTANTSQEPSISKDAQPTPPTSPKGSPQMTSPVGSPTDNMEWHWGSLPEKFDKNSKASIQTEEKARSALLASVDHGSGWSKYWRRYFKSSNDAAKPAYLVSADGEDDEDDEYYDSYDSDDEFIDCETPEKEPQKSGNNSLTDVICTSTEPASVPQNATSQQEGHPLQDTSSNKASASIPPTPPSLTLNSPQVPSSQQPSSPQLATSQQPGPTVTPQEKNAQPVSASEPRVMTAAEIADIQLEFSICAHLLQESMDEPTVHTIFTSNLLSYNQLVTEPTIIFNKNGVCRFNGKLYPSVVAAPILASVFLFKKPLTQATIDSLYSQWQQERNKQNTGWLWWVASPRTAVPNPVKKAFKKTIRPTHEQLAMLDLAKGMNQVSFSINSGSEFREVTAAIFLVDSLTKLVISDIDGTITKSDMMGHIFTFIGRDWNQSGVAELFSSITDNGYSIIYLTSRPIGQAKYTRDFIASLKQKTQQESQLATLPLGPVFTSPFRLFSAVDKEMIKRHPEEFKIECLEDIKSLFPSDSNPFYAGFGNRISDVISYKLVGIPEGKIFTINHLGDLRTTNRTYKKSYTELNKLVDTMFPALTHRPGTTETQSYNDTNFWSIPLPKV